ncbi:putative extracellular solute-binding protein [Magnetofaba australis IT-1]|uniref:Putative extracellular solute-binding protein n=2 Tax=Magnetofaba TaxID=1472292 RepID=A0A1Y2K2L0_9PROT|nr:putative extracellular solute-binding protein [Magnetofaba australis IT-1]
MRAPERGDLLCGVTMGAPHFSALQANGQWRGFFVDMCRALAAAALGDPNAVIFHEVDGVSRFSLLQSGGVDVVMSNVTWTLGRERDYGVNFPAIYLYDGQAAAARAAKGWRKLEQAEGAVICVGPNTTSHLNLLDWARVRGLHFNVVTLRRQSILNGLMEGRCDLTTDDRFSLAGNLNALSAQSGAYVIFDNIFSREPLSPMVRQDDPQWARVVRAVVHALMLAEEYGVTKSNVAERLQQAQVGEERRLLGLEGDVGAGLGLHPQWAARVIAAVGNYGEIFERHLGRESALALSRGHNALWRDGGLLYPIAFR